MRKEDLHKIAPELSNIPRDTTRFELPENYFDAFEDIVIARLKAEIIQNDHENVKLPENYFDSIEATVLTKIETSPTIISLRSRIVKFAVPIAIAASLLLFFMLNDDSNTVTFDSLALSEIENWIDNGTIDIDASSIASIYPEIELNNDYVSSSISDNEVLEYLYEEDLEEIMNDN
ncbi:hypothetical protein JYT50_00390 [bacterium AH-315-A23]|nr:hypothetical protein [bacterium AH-315-A23]PHS51354.1 MAG: hypothetical protein COB01_10625 [Lutibacter sp.]